MMINKDSPLLTRKKRLGRKENKHSEVDENKGIAKLSSSISLSPVYRCIQSADQATKTIRRYRHDFVDGASVV